MRPFLCALVALGACIGADGGQGGRGGDRPANLLTKNTGERQEDIDLRWNGLDSACLRAFFFENDCNDEMGVENGTPTGLTYLPTPYGLGANFTGTAGCVNIGSADDIDSLTEFTIALWVYCRGLGGGNAGKFYWKGGNTRFEVGSESGGYVGIYANVRCATTSAEYTKLYPLEENEWHHVAFTYSDSGDRKICFWLDGVQVSGTQVAGEGERASDAAENGYIGDIGDASCVFNGIFSQFLLCGRVLTSTEILWLAKGGLLGLWKFENDCRDELGVHHGAGSNISYVGGALGQAVSFAYSSGVVNIGRSYSLRNLNRFALRARILVPSQPANTWGVIAEKYYDGGSAGWTFLTKFAAGGYQIASIVKMSTSQAFSMSAAAQLCAYNTWYEVVATFDEFGDKKIRFYRDGVELGYDTQTAGVGTVLNDDGNNLRFGNSPDLARPLKGYMEILAIHRSPLPAADITGLPIMVSGTDRQTILQPTPGGWDNRGVRDPSLLVDEQQCIVRNASGQYVMVYTGKDASNVGRVGRAVSTDGINWTKEPATCILDVGAPGSWEESNLISGALIKLSDGTYRLYYTGRNAAGLRGVGLATSSDGLAFTKHPGNPLILATAWVGTKNFLGLTTVQRLSTGQWAFMFEGGGTFQNYLGLSADGINWTPGNSGNPVMTGTAGQWDEGGVANPKLVELEPGKYLLGYNGRSAAATDWRIAFAYSSILTSWTKFASNPVFPVADRMPWEKHRIENAFIAKQDVGTDAVRMWYFAGPDDYSFKVGYLTCPQRSMDIWNLIDVTGWEGRSAKDLHGGYSARLSEVTGAAKQFYETKTLTAEDYVVSFLAYNDGTAVTSADVVPFADTGGFVNEISSFNYDHQGNGIYLCWGKFTATAAAWNIGVEVCPCRVVHVGLPTCYAECPPILDITGGKDGPGAITLTWPALAGARYEVLWSERFARPGAPTWTSAAYVTAGGASATWADLGSPDRRPPWEPSIRQRCYTVAVPAQVIASP